MLEMINATVVLEYLTVHQSEVRHYYYFVLIAEEPYLVVSTLYLHTSGISERVHYSASRSDFRSHFNARFSLLLLSLPGLFGDFYCYFLSCDFFRFLSTTFCILLLFP